MEKNYNLIVVAQTHESFIKVKTTNASFQISEKSVIQIYPNNTVKYLNRSLILLLKTTGFKSFKPGGFFLTTPA